MSDCVARETGKGDDPQGNVALADTVQCEQVVADEIAVARHHQCGGNEDAPARLGFERSYDFANIDAAQEMKQHDRGDTHDREADSDTEPAPLCAAHDCLRK